MPSSTRSPATGPPVLVGVVEHDDHRTWPDHPERPARLDAIRRALRDPALEGVVAPIEGRPASYHELTRVHDPRYLYAVGALADRGGGELDPDTPVAAGSWLTAVAGAGLGLAAIEALRAGPAVAAFVAPRPPGHHARPDRGMGFCLLNNVAVAAAALVAEGERVLIVDWDVHHGNGTQDIFWDDPDVLYVSTHQWPAYPGTGRPGEVGGPSAVGTVVNVPLPVGATGDVARAALDEIVAPAVDAFGPTWVLISAGFDAHRWDPLGDLAWSAGDFAALARTVTSWAPGPGRTLAVLEGGYDLDALARCTTAAVAGLGGATVPTEAPTHGGPGRDLVMRAAAARDRACEGGP
jgi:acetoin utilization deacetylase AcuC-like enzyme